MAAARRDAAGHGHGYTPDARAEMARILAAAAKGDPADIDLIIVELLDIVHGLSLASDGSESAVIWNERADTQPSHKELAAAFERAANDEDPIATVRADTNLAARLSGRIRNRWASRWRREGRSVEPGIRHVAWDSLSDAERSEIRDMLIGLARFERQFVRRSRPHKSRLDNALSFIAETYLRAIGDTNTHRWDVPYARESLFIQFAHQALSPAGPSFETSAQALSRRWSRVVGQERELHAELDRPDEPGAEAR